MKKLLLIFFFLVSCSANAAYVCAVSGHGIDGICGDTNAPDAVGKAIAAVNTAKDANGGKYNYSSGWFDPVSDDFIFNGSYVSFLGNSYPISGSHYYFYRAKDCPDGYVRNPYTGNCQLPCPDKGDANPDFYGQKSMIYGTSDPDSVSQVCQSDYCSYNTTGSTTCISAGSQSFCIVKMGSSTGEMCGVRNAVGSSGEPGTVPPGDESHDPTNPGSPADCAEAGMAAGNVNGKTVCYKPAGSSSTTKETTTTDSSTSTSDSGGNSTGSTTETQETKFTTIGSDGTATTTTTTKTCERDISGFVTCKDNTTTKTSTASDYCKENPKDSRCQQGGTFGGSCSGGFTCSGDAVQCAIAKENHKRNCDLFDTRTPLSDLGNSFINGTDVDSSAMPWHSSNLTEVDLSSKALDESRSLSGQCVRSVSVNVMGRELTFNLNPFCDLMGKLSYLVVALAMLAGARIIAGVSK